MYTFVGFNSLLCDEPKLLWVLTHAYPCSRHENRHTGDVLVHLAGWLVSGLQDVLYSIGAGAFHNQEKFLGLFV